MLTPAAFNPYKQFILWRAVPSTRQPGKTDKQPIDPTHHRPSDPNSPANWLTADQAIQLAAVTGYGVGFVFTEQDPFFFFDIDNCATAEGWSPLAIQLCAQFAGCAIEVSQSGKGLHIFGAYSARPEHGCRNQALDLELYTSKRFVALTGSGLQGDAISPPADALQTLIASHFQPSAICASTDWTDRPSDEWNGPTDDDELISKMLIARTSAAAAFSNRASVGDLWRGNTDALAAAYPSGSDAPFDHSSADAALCQHLAFWTGKDCARIDALFRQSALYREKWENRPDYRERTVLYAVSLCRNVYSQTNALADTGEDLRAGFQYKTISDQIEYFAGCVYIRDLHRIFTPDGALLKSEQFRAMYGGQTFALDSVNGKVGKNAWEAFTESQGYDFPKAHGVCFRPEEKPGAMIREENRDLVNTYVPIETPRKAGDITPFLKHVGLVLPVERDREILLAYMAACVQYPGVKFQWCPLIQGTEGNGKTLFISIMENAIGRRYSHLPNASDLGGNGQKFNSWIQGKLFIGVEEIYVSDRREVSEALKSLITNRRIEIQGKGADQITGDNRANFMMCTNHKDGLHITIDGRRYCILFSGQQSKADKVRDGMAGRYFPDLYNWLNADGYAIVTDWLYNYKIPYELNPADYCQEAPRTSSTLEAVELSRGRVEQEILEAIDEGKPGFAGGWVSSMALDRLLESRRDNKIVPPNRRRGMLKGLGYEPHPGLSTGRVNNIIPQEGGKPRLYITTGHPTESLTVPVDIAKVYLIDQGYSAEGVWPGGSG